MDSEEIRCPGGPPVTLTSLGVGMRPAVFRASCRAPSGGHFYVVSSLRSSSEIRNRWDVTLVSGAYFQEARNLSGIILVVPGRRPFLSIR